MAQAVEQVLDCFPTPEGDETPWTVEETIDILLGELHGKQLDLTQLFPEKRILVRDYPGLHLHWNWRFQPQKLRDRTSSIMEGNSHLSMADLYLLLGPVYQQIYEENGFQGNVGIWGPRRTPTVAFTPTTYLYLQTVLEKSNQLDVVPRLTPIDHPTLPTTYNPYVFEINSTRKGNVTRIDIATGEIRRGLYDDRERLMRSIEKGYRGIPRPFEGLFMIGVSQRMVNRIRGAIV